MCGLGLRRQISQGFPGKFSRARRVLWVPDQERPSNKPAGGWTKGQATRGVKVDADGARVCAMPESLHTKNHTGAELRRKAGREEGHKIVLKWHTQRNERRRERRRTKTWLSSYSWSYSTKTTKSVFHCDTNNQVSDVFVFNASLSALAPSAPMLLSACWCWLLAMSAIHPSSTLSSCSPHRFSDWSVVFVFNASLSALAPSAPISLSACWCWLLAMSAIHPSSSLSSCSLHRLSDWSVVLIFNASLSALAPSAPNQLPAC